MPWRKKPWFSLLNLSANTQYFIYYSSVKPVDPYQPHVVPAGVLVRYKPHVSQHWQPITRKQEGSSSCVLGEAGLVQLDAAAWQQSCFSNKDRKNNEMKRYWTCTGHALKSCWHSSSPISAAAIVNAQSGKCLSLPDSINSSSSWGLLQV